MITPGTIAAIASPRGPGARGVIRVSGPQAWDVVEAVWTGVSTLPPRTRRGFSWGRFDDGGGVQPLLLLWMPGPRSFTREDVAEFHLPGSPPLLEAALARVLSLNVRAAEAGEFTRRAFENGRIDLTRAEGILELVQARSESERRSATALLLGGLSNRLAPLREALVALRALAEASLDFDEADTGHVPGEELERGARSVLQGLTEASRWEARRVATSDLPQVVLMGAPNAGKSSLFNALLPEAQALVSDLPGTTRDVLVGEWTLDRGSVRLVDTAGLDQAQAGPDGQAQEFGGRYQESADLQLWLADPAQTSWLELRESLTGRAAGSPRVLVWTKADVGRSPELPPGEESLPAQLGFAAVLDLSARDRRGLEDLARRVSESLWPQGQPEDASARIDREIGVRHQVALAGAAEALETGLSAWLGGLPLDLFAESLRSAGTHLDSIDGRTTAEDLLTRIFSSFCIGK